MEKDRAILGAALVLPFLLIISGFAWYFDAGAHPFIELHTVVELLAVATGLFVFWIANEGYALTKNVRIRIIGLAFLAMAALDFFHTFAFPGIEGVFYPTSTNTSILFWVAARLSGAALLAIAFFVPQRMQTVSFGRDMVAATLVFLPLAVYAIILNIYSPFLPQMFVAGEGLTKLKVALELAAAALYALAAWAAYRIWDRNRERAVLLFSVGLVLSAYSELSLMLYSGPYDVFMVIGHVLKLLSFGSFLCGLWCVWKK
jgi:hypothetical protein